jgi:N-acetylmuramoyl-L-alanine amidase
MKRIFIEAGHNNSDCGAIGNGFKEADLTKEARNGIAAVLKASNFKGEVILGSDAHSLGSTINYFNSHKPTKDDLLISLHFNAATPQAKGTEVVYRANASEDVKGFCRYIAEIIVRDTKWVLRGDKGIVSEVNTPHKKLGILQIVPKSALIEFCFISNAEEIKQYQSAKNSIWNNIAVYLIKRANATI